MPHALLDTTVLFAAAYRRDANHDAGLPILRGIDNGSLPQVIVLDYVLAETLNGLVTNSGNDAAVDLLDRIERNDRFQIATFTADELSAGKSLFRRYDSLSFVDSCIAAYMQAESISYLYAFDDDFDVLDGVRRLDTTVNPYEPE